MKRRLTAGRVCKVPGCGCKVKCNDLCNKCDRRLRSKGRLGYVTPPWKPEHDRQLLSVLRDTPGGIGRAPHGELAALAVHLERSRCACSQRLGKLRRRKQDEIASGLDLI